MITLIHGENPLQAQKELSQIRQAASGKDIVVLAKPESLVLRQNLASDSMFGGDKLIIVEQLLEKGLSQDVIAFLASDAVNDDCVFIEKKALDKGKADASKKKTEGKQKDAVLKGKKLLDAMQKQIPSLKIIACNDYSLFNFLDLLIPGNGSKLISEYQALLAKKYTAEEIYFLVVDHLRNLVIAADMGAGGLGSMHAFRQGKILSQSQRYTPRQLKTIYQKLYQVEVAQKLKRVGEGSPFSMEEDFSFFLATAFAK